jgi:hypothetical protein
MVPYLSECLCKMRGRGGEVGVGLPDVRFVAAGRVKPARGVGLKVK